MPRFLQAIGLRSLTVLAAVTSGEGMPIMSRHAQTMVPLLNTDNNPDTEARCGKVNTILTQGRIRRPERWGKFHIRSDTVQDLLIGMEGRMLVQRQRSRSDNSNLAKRLPANIHRRHKRHRHESPLVQRKWRIMRSSPQTW